MIRRAWKVALGLVALCCGAMASAEAPRVLLLDGNDSRLTIGQLKPAYIDFSYRAAPRVAITEIVQRYVRLLRSTRDPAVRLKALERLASLQSLFGKVVEEAVARENLGAIAVETYEDHLRTFKDSANTDWLLYDLARAYDGAGRTNESRGALERLVKNYPRSELAAESWFRIGEIAFGQGDYAAAETAFRKTLAERGSQPFVANAEYMLGWALFKRSRLPEATDAFVVVLTRLQKQAEQNVRTELRDDVLRTLGVLAEYQKGAATLHAALERNRAENLAPLVYRSYYAFLLTRERYQDAAAVVDHFIASYPQSPGRVAFHQFRIDAFEQGGLPSLAWEEKERVVSQVSPGTVYWNQQAEEGRTAVREFLYRNLDQLGRKYYATAPLSAEPRRDWKVAASYFERYVEMFPADARTAEVLLLLAESRLKQGDWQAAIPAFEKAAYEFPAYPERAAAAYAALSSYPADLDWATQSDLRRTRVAAYERFADTFAQDPRAAAVLLAAASEHHTLEDFEAAVKAAGSLSKAFDTAPAQAAVAGAQQLTSAQRMQTWEILGHAHFKLQDYALAEGSYARALKELPERSGERSALTENLAASIYRQGEILQQQGRLAEAKQEYLRVLTVAPDTAVARTAHYDAAMRAIDLAEWTLAVELLSSYRQKYPLEAAAAEVGQKLVYSHQQAGNPLAAAGELLALESLVDAESGRKARFQAAGLYQEAGRSEQAEEAYVTYVQKYPRPLEPAIQACASLVGIAVAAGRDSDAESWRQRLIDLESQGGQERTPATRTLAAKAALETAEVKKVAYEAQKLTLPLNQSLSRKSEQLKELVNDLNRVTSYGIQDYVTASTHLMGLAYLQLGQDILQSERPPRLSDLENQQYDLLLEEQAFPFEEKAIGILEANVRRVPQGVYDKWIEQSLLQLAQVQPSRYAREEALASVINELK